MGRRLLVAAASTPPALIYEAEVTAAVESRYTSKTDAWQQLRSLGATASPSREAFLFAPATRDAPDQGWLLGWRYAVVHRLGLVLPTEVVMVHGWARVDHVRLAEPALAAPRPGEDNDSPERAFEAALDPALAALVQSAGARGRAPLAARVGVSADRGTRRGGGRTLRPARRDRHQAAAGGGPWARRRPAARHRDRPRDPGFVPGADDDAGRASHRPAAGRRGRVVGDRRAGISDPAMAPARNPRCCRPRFASTRPAPAGSPGIETSGTRVRNSGSPESPARPPLDERPEPHLCPNCLSPGQETGGASWTTPDWSCPVCGTDWGGSE